MLSIVMGWLTSKLAGPIAAGIAALLLVVTVWQNGQINGWPLLGGGLRAELASANSTVSAMTLDRVKFQAAQLALVAGYQQKLHAAGEREAAAYAGGLAASQTNTQTIIRKVPVYVSQKSDAACVVPWGAVRLLDAAASGADPGFAAARIAPGVADDAASDVKLSEAVALLAADLGAARDNADQLRHLEAAIAAGDFDGKAQ